MQKIAGFTLLFSIFLLLFLNAKNTANDNKGITPSPTTTETNTPTPSIVNNYITEIGLNNNKFQTAWFVVNSPEKLFLYPNFTQKLPSFELKKTNNCNSLVNAGFYDKSNKPLGLFISEGKVISEEIESFLFNGVFFLDDKNLPEILVTPPKINIRLAVQSGPILWEEGTERTLKIIDDKMARRMIIGITEKKEIIFLSFYDKESPLQGPYLQDLPKLIRILNDKMDLKILSALNLDGGSASAFSANNLTLSEISNIGSFFCEKQ